MKAENVTRTRLLRTKSSLDTGLGKTAPNAVRRTFLPNGPSESCAECTLEPGYMCSGVQCMSRDEEEAACLPLRSALGPGVNRFSV